MAMCRDIRARHLHRPSLLGRVEVKSLNYFKIVADATYFLLEYGNALDDAGIPPNGDDYNALAAGIGAILAGREPAPIKITEAGR